MFKSLKSLLTLKNVETAFSRNFGTTTTKKVKGEVTTTAKPIATKSAPSPKKTSTPKSKVEAQVVTAAVESTLSPPSSTSSTSKPKSKKKATTTSTTTTLLSAPAESSTPVSSTSFLSSSLPSPSPSPPPPPPPSSSSSSAPTPLRSITPVVPEPSWLKSCIRFEDDDLVIISKPSGIASQPGGNEPSINDYLDQLEEKVGSSLRIVHRLDQETSGLLMLARSKESAAALSEGLKEGLIKKEYIGLSLFPPIASSTSSSIRTISSGGGGGGGNSGINKGFSIQEGICKHPIERTQWRQGTPGVVDSVEQWSAETVFKATTSLSSGFTIWRLSPLTGRRHQLRQHVLHLTNRMGGLLGDPKYYGKSKALLNSSSSPSSSTSSSLSSPGLMLHAFQLTIPAFTLGRHQVRDLIVKEELPSRIQAQLRLYSIPSRVISAALE